MSAGLLGVALLMALGSAAQPAQQPVTPYTPQQPADAPSEHPPRKATPEDLAGVRVQIDAGDMRGALDLLSRLEPSPDVLRLRIDALTALGAVDDALAAYEAWSTLLGQDDVEVLGRLTVLVLQQALDSADQLLALEACSTLLSRGSHSCSQTLARQMDDTQVPFAVRIAAASILARHGITGGVAGLRSLAASASGLQHRSVVDAAADLDSGLAVPLLAAALGSTDEGIQYAAAQALGNHGSGEARAALEKYLEAQPAPMPRGAARLALARLGDEEWFQQFLAVMPQLDGDMLMRIGEILTSRGDPRGAQAIARVAATDHDLLRVAAAARLPAADPVAAEVLAAALSGENPWTRAGALEEFRASPLLSLTRARTSLADREPWVRVQAAAAVLRRLPPAAQVALPKQP